MVNKEVVMITGAGGLIGHALRQRLEEQGTTVLPIDRFSRSAEGFELVECDVTDIHRLHSLIISKRVTSIVHCGAYSGPMVARENPHAIVDVNIGGTANLLEAARIHSLRRVVNCSSITVYGSTSPGLVMEDAPVAPTNVYGASKASGEHLVNAYALRYGLDAVSLRISSVYGPRRKTHCFIRTMIQNAFSKQTTSLPFGEDFHRQYIYIDDAVTAIVLALTSPTLKRRTYNVTGGSWKTMSEIAGEAHRALPNVEVLLRPGLDPDDDDDPGRLDISAAHNDLGYSPKWSLEEGIKAYAEWIKANDNVA